MGWCTYGPVSLMSRFFNNVKVLDKEKVGSWGPVICYCLSKQSFIHSQRGEITNNTIHSYSLRAGSQGRNVKQNEKISKNLF